MSNLLHLSFQFNINWALRSSMDFDLGNKKDTQKLLKAGRYKEKIPHSFMLSQSVQIIKQDCWNLK